MEAAVCFTDRYPDSDPPDAGGDEFYYGHRTLIEYDEAGEETYRYVPLTPDDFLDPEEGDVFMQGSLHTDTVEKLRSIFRHHLRNRKNLTVYSDLKIIWGEGKKNPAPDICVIADVDEPERNRGVFSVQEEGCAPFFILEVVSPRYRIEDIVKKTEIYRQAGVSEYIIVDPGLKNNVVSYTILGYRLIGNRYISTSPDSKGRIYSRMTDVWIGVSESGDRLRVYDGQTGETVLPDQERAEQEEARAEQEKERAEQEKARAEQEKARAEQEKARAEQEKARAEQEKARAEQEKARAEQEKARAEQEKARAEQEKARAEKAEEEIRHLMAMLKKQETEAG